VSVSQPELVPEYEVACSACGSAAQRVLRSQDALAEELAELERFHARRFARRSRARMQERASFTHDYPTRVVECEICGLLYRSPRPRASAVLAAYEQERYAEERLEQLHESQFASLRPGARVLEVGSYVGAFLRAAVEVGLEPVGLDPSAQMSQLSQRHGLRVERATLEELADDVPRMRWDAICVFNTFDQLPDPNLTLAAASRLLVHGGTLLLRVPNGSLYRQRAQRPSGFRADLAFPALAWNNLIGFPYLHGYTLTSLDLLLRRHGFERRDVVGDTLCTLADGDYAAWARVEEALWKSAQRLRARVSPESSPWLDVRYQAS
jgi:SAM-dependent methyltransferase